MLTYILTAGCLLIVPVIAMTVYFRYQDEVKFFDQILIDIQYGDLEDIKEGLQSSDYNGYLSSEMNTILMKPFIDYVEIRLPNDKMIFVGEKTDGEKKEIIYPIIDIKSGKTEKLGDLYIQANDSDFFKRIWESVLRDAIFMVIIILVTCLIFFLGFEYLIGRHLQDMVHYTNRKDLSQMEEPFRLKRKIPDYPDELGNLAVSLNQMYKKLYEALEDLRITNQNLAMEIDERKQAENALEEEQALLTRRVEERTAELSTANADLSKAARMKDEFMASMSHELRTPLAGILGLSEALSSKVYGDLNDRQVNAVRQINQSGDTLLKTINDIIDLSRIQTNQIELVNTCFNIDSLCQSCIRLVKQQATRKKISISTAIEKQGLTIRSDERRLKQVVVNLLNNAVKFTPENGEIGVEINTDIQNHLLSISIWDNGIGISEEDQKKLFKPFKQLDSGLSRRYSGPGLGLALVISLVKLMGGGIKLVSTSGRGSRFTITLPWNPETLDKSTNVSAQPSNQVENALFHQEFHASHQRIMIVDDNEVSLISLRDYLANLGARVIISRNSTEAMSTINENPPDILLMDILLPGLDGLEMIRRLRKDEKTASIYIIALTALALEGDQQRCLEAGANDYFAKPFPYHALATAIYRYLLQNKEKGPVSAPGLYYG